METSIKQALLVALATAFLLGVSVAHAETLACIQDRPWKGDGSGRSPGDPLQDSHGASTPSGQLGQAEPWNGPRDTSVR
jgi:hypothetical protein